MGGIHIKTYKKNEAKMYFPVILSNICIFDKQLQFGITAMQKKDIFPIHNFLNPLQVYLEQYFLVTPGLIKTT